jgi:DNA polymerase III subunit gamma/tau
MTKDQIAPYQGLSRLYRPQTFASVLGQDAIVMTLKNALKQKKTAGAYLFSGTRGTGKTTLARVLAKALNCHNLSDEMEPCGTCESCQEIMEGRNLNVFEIDGASNRGIDDIRQLNETVGYAPSSHGCKIFIIDEAHMLTKEAFNALLKTLEEPPPNVKFFLATTEPHKIPPTIISRCQRFDLQRISIAKITEKLSQIIDKQEVPYEEEALHRIAALSDGSMRVAESLLDQILCFSEGPITEKGVALSLATLPAEAFFDFDEAFAKGNLRFAFTFAESIFSSGKDLTYFLECLLEHYRNILAVQMKLPLEGIPSSFQKKYQEAAAIYTEEQALYLLDYLVQWHQTASKSPFKRVSLEMILLHILRSKHRVSAADLVFRLENLQQTPEPAPIVEHTPVIEKKPETKQPVAEKKQPALKEEKPKVQVATTSRHDTLMRFASVELEGTFTND